MEEEQKTFEIKAIIEIMGSPKEHVENTLSSVLDKLKEAKGITILKEKKSIPVEVEPKPFWSSFCEVELSFTDEETLFGFCFDFMPSSIEILRPEKLDMNKGSFENFLNDLLARLHQYDMVLKNIHAQNIMLKKEMEKLTGKKFAPPPSRIVEETDEKK